MSEEKPKIKSITIGAKNIGAAESSMVSPALPLEVEQYIEYLEAENKGLKEKIKVVCKGMSPPKFNPKEVVGLPKLDLTKPEVAFMWGWESAIFECGEILSKPQLEAELKHEQYIKENRNEDKGNSNTG